MSEEKKLDAAGNEIISEVVVDDEYRKPDPKLNPRNISLGEIAARVAKQHVEDEKIDSNVPSIDDDGNVTPAPASPAAAPEAEPPSPDSAEPPVSQEPVGTEPPAGEPGTEALDPTKEYEVVVHGQKIKVPGKAIIDAGIATVQKGSEADYRLRVASELLTEAERRLASTTAPGDVTKPAAPAPAGGKTEAELAHMLQFGTPEQSAEAVKQLMKGGASEERILGLVSEASRAAAKDEIEFQGAKRYLQREFGDVLAKEPLRNLFFSEEARLRQAGDRRPYGELYKAIGESIRKDFSISKPAAPAQGQPAAGSLEARKAAKAAAPAVPRTAAARLQEVPGEKAKSPSEVIAGMAAARGKDRLSPTRR